VSAVFDHPMFTQTSVSSSIKDPSAVPSPPKSDPDPSLTKDYDRYHAIAITSANSVVWYGIDNDGAALMPNVVNTLLNPISLELKQLLAFTSATFSGSAKVISTQLNKLAPWTATSTT